MTVALAPTGLVFESMSPVETVFSTAPTDTATADGVKAAFTA